MEDASSSLFSSSSLASFWSAFNAPDSFLPLYLPLVVWILTYLSCPLTWYRWYRIHNLHNCGGMLLASLSLYFNNDDVFNERIPILWSLGYFGVDIVDCCWRQDVTYIFHGAFCFLLGYANYSTPVLRLLRMNSKAAFCELSNPLMHLSKQTRDPQHFAMFATVFTACRIVWLPILYRQMITIGNMKWYDLIALVLAGFYALNWMWYIKIIRIVMEGAAGKIAKKEVKRG